MKTVEVKLTVGDTAHFMHHNKAQSAEIVEIKLTKTDRSRIGRPDITRIYKVMVNAEPGDEEQYRHRQRDENKVGLELTDATAFESKEALLQSL